MISIKRIRNWIDCRLKRKHRYSVYDNRCIVCGKYDGSVKRIEKI